MKSPLLALSAVVLLSVSCNSTSQNAASQEVEVKLELPLPAHVPNVLVTGGLEDGGMVSNEPSAEMQAARFVRAVAITAGRGLQSAGYENGQLTLAGSTSAVENASDLARKLTVETNISLRPQANIDTRFMSIDAAGLADLPAEFRATIARVHSQGLTADFSHEDFTAILKSGSFQSLTTPTLMLFTGQNASVTIARGTAGKKEELEGLQLTVGAVVKGEEVALHVRAELARGFEEDRQTITLDRLLLTDGTGMVLAAAEYMTDANGNALDEEPLVLIFVRASAIHTVEVMKIDEAQ